MDYLSFLHAAEIDEAKDNPRAITPERYEALKHSLRTQPDMLLARPLVVDARHGDIVAGNMRKRAALDILTNEEGTKLHAFVERYSGIPVYTREFTDTERREWMIRDNNEYGDWVPEELAALVAAHEAEGADMSLLGLTTSEMSDLLALASDELADTEPEPDDIPPDTWGVVIECEDEAQQAELLEEFAERGLTVRALIA